MCRSYVTPDSCSRLTAETAERAETKSLNHRDTETQKHRGATGFDGRRNATHASGVGGMHAPVGCRWWGSRLRPIRPRLSACTAGRPVEPRRASATDAFLALCVSVIDS